MKLGLQIPEFDLPGGPATLGVELARVAGTADEAGFDIVAVMDHVWQIGMIGPPERDMLEAYTALSFLAAHTRRARLLALVSGASLRPPGMLLKQVSTLDVLSGGRAMLGLGAGWFEQEARGLGLPFPALAERFDRLEETLQIAHRMFSGSEEPFVGKYYQLDRPLNHPAPLNRPGIMVGGSGEQKTLRLVARYADACNLFAGPGVTDKLAVLRKHCEREHRDFDSIEKTGLMPFDLSNGPEALIDQLGTAREAGLTTVIGFLPNVWTGDSLDLLCSVVLPRAAAL